MLHGILRKRGQKVIAELKLQTRTI